MDASLFMTELDIHLDKPLVDEDLRAYVIQHSLFFEKLLVTDSAFNNNPNFRKLMWDKEATDHPASYPQDLWQLTEKGILIPTVRNEYGSLTVLRNQHAARNVQDIPSEDYTTFMDATVGSNAETYNIHEVEDLFSRRTQDALSDSKNIGKGKISKKVSNFILEDYVKKQKTLNFNDFKIWMGLQVGVGKLTSDDFEFVTSLTSQAYRHNVGHLLHKNLDIPYSQSRNLYPVDITVGDTEKIPESEKSRTIELQSSVVFSREILSQLPASVIVEIKNHNKNYTNIVQTLEIFRAERIIDFEKFSENLQEYLVDIEVAAHNYFTPSQNAKFLPKNREKVIKGVIKYSSSLARIGVGVATMNPYIVIGLGAYELINVGVEAYKEYVATNRHPEFYKGYLVCRHDIVQHIYEIKK